MAIRAIVIWQLKGQLLAAKDLMQEVASCTREHYGERFVFDPYVDTVTGRVVWLNVVSDEEALVQWEQDMGEKTGFRSRVRAMLEPVSTDILDPIDDPRLDRLRDASTMMSSMLN
jgi:hypothetical protein